MGILRPMKQRALHRYSLFAGLLCVSVFAAFLLGGCGKSGMPSPKKTQDTFTITGHALTPMGDCVVARGTVSGAIQNVEFLTLEVAPIESYDDCPGCPFVPREYGEFTAYDAQLDEKTGQFMFSFCPASGAPMYRWRLVGKNAFRGLPFATTTPRVMVMPQQ
ncbi:putative Lipoprotein [uncultured delta proteobacterium]|uniref:Putative Lipoprotein n=1 Tax=uncultured delta proteobacterium TaxID=34034 RepID=A0A212J458_9DELT|nr:putative Lipoprotein [uncultured delta proteobacterium]